MADSILDISKILTNYAEGIQEAITEEAKKIGKEGATRLKNTKGTYKVRSGDYNKSWKTKEETGANFVHVSIHSEKHYRLTHLLEYGHATRDGKRTKAFPHIEPVDDFVKETFVNNVEEIIKRGGK